MIELILDRRRHPGINLVVYGSSLRPVAELDAYDPEGRLKQKRTP